MRNRTRGRAYLVFNDKYLIITMMKILLANILRKKDRYTNMHSLMPSCAYLRIEHTNSTK